MSWLRIASLALLTAGLANAQNESPGKRFELGSFLPAEIESRYRAEPCNVDVKAPCTLWTAGDDESRYLIFPRSARNAGFWRSAQSDAIVRSVVPQSLAASPLSIVQVPRKGSSEPLSFNVLGTATSGQVQMLIGDDVLVVWMPDTPQAAGFETIEVSQVDPPAPKQLTEIGIPNTPDVIDEDSSGDLWFSAWENEIYRLDPTTDVPQAMTGGAATGTPDGMVVDSRDSVWFGAYGGQSMGNVSDGTTLVRYPMPYSPSHPAIPCEASSGNIWITDHLANRITEFDPLVEAWGRSILMPVALAWVTACKPDPSTDALWMTMYQAQSLGRLDLSTNAVDRYPLPCAPAFLALDARGVWATCWNNGNIVQFDPASGTGRVYRIPGGSQAGGISIDVSGRIVFTQNILGRVAVLDPDAQEVFAYQLPSRRMFKDGVLAAKSGTLWAPSPSGHLLAKIVP